MKPTESVLESAAPECPGNAAPGQSFGLNVMAVYQDIQSRQEVLELFRRVTRSIGQQPFHLQMCNFHELNESGIFEAAVAAAEGADVLIVALRAAENLHPRFCAWIDAWLPRRRRPDGTLIALIDVGGTPGASSERVQKYLRTVAWEAHLELLLRELIAGAPGRSDAAGKATAGDAAASSPRDFHFYKPDSNPQDL